MSRVCDAIPAGRRGLPGRTCTASASVIVAYPIEYVDGRYSGPPRDLCRIHLAVWDSRNDQEKLELARAWGWSS